MKNSHNAFAWRSLLVSALALALSACGSDSDGVEIPSQHLKNMEVRVEPHPNPPVVGMSDVVVIITGERGRPVQDLIVSVRGSDAIPWVQSIQDGHIGVYRRAVLLVGGMPLQVRLQQGETQDVLSFPLGWSER